MTSLSPPIQSVLDLFKGPLADVRFAHIDAAGLASLAAEVEAAGAEVEQQEDKLTELRQALAQRQDALLALAQQALAYARVYAEHDEALLEELNRISLPKPAKPRKPSGKATSARDATRAVPLNEVPLNEVPLNEPGDLPETDVAPEATEAMEAEAVEEQPPRAVRKGRGRGAQPTAT
jgi:hypothetical protein